MKTATLVACLALALASVDPCAAVPGVVDLVPAASVLLPFFEVGVDPAIQPQNTLLVVTNTWYQAVTIHYIFWNIDGSRSTVYGNVTLAARASWSVSARDRIAAGSDVARAVLLDPHDHAFYRGFVTIDSVTAATSLPPTHYLFPFAYPSALVGFAYYVGLAPNGTANGLAMVPIEHTIIPVDTPMQGYYRLAAGRHAAARREQHSTDARACASQHVYSGRCDGDFENHAMDQIILRVFGGTAFSGVTRSIVFTWTPGRTGGPTVLCAASGKCPTSYRYTRYAEGGGVLESGMRELRHVVNLTTENPGLAGWMWINYVPSVDRHTQVYALSFNRGSVPGHPELVFDTVLEGYVSPF